MKHASLEKEATYQITATTWLSKPPVTAVKGTQAVFFSVEQVLAESNRRPCSPRVPICAGKSRPNTCAAVDKEID